MRPGVAFRGEGVLARKDSTEKNTPQQTNTQQYFTSHYFALLHFRRVINNVEYVRKSDLYINHHIYIRDIVWIKHRRKIREKKTHRNRRIAAPTRTSFLVRFTCHQKMKYGSKVMCTIIICTYIGYIIWIKHGGNVREETHRSRRTAALASLYFTSLL